MTDKQDSGIMRYHTDQWIKEEQHLPIDDNPVYVKQLMRYKRYKPQSSQYKSGLTGRWQSWNGYGWNNCEAPCEWALVDDQG